MSKWKDCGNSVALHFGGFYLSYNNNSEPNPLDRLMIALGQYKPENYGRPETAIVIISNESLLGTRFLILYGDHRGALEICANQGLDACIEYWQSHHELWADSTDSIPIGTVN